MTLFNSLALCGLALLSLVQAQESTPQRLIQSDFQSIKAPKSPAYFKCVGAGRANEGLRADWQRHMRDVQKNFPFEFVRFHGLLHDDMGVCSLDNQDKTKLVYNFQYIDELYDFLLSVNIKPFVELSFMPSPLKSGDKTVFWWKGNITPPSSYEDWADMVTKLVEHLTKRYGREEVASWYFEVWNEPNHPSFFSGKQVDYFKLYSVTAHAIKAVDSSYRVGGPATAGNGWVSDTIKYCQESKTPLDFIATHTYGVWGAGLDEFGVKQLRLAPNPDSVAHDVKRVRAAMEKLGQEEMELHYTEWSSSYSPRDLTHDSYLNAPYVLNALRHVEGAAQSMSYWTFTDVFEESGVPTTPLHGGFGLINMQDLRKPTYFAYKFLYELGETELQNEDSCSWVCKDDKGGVQILAYNITLPDFKETVYNNKEFSVLREPKDLGGVKIDLANLPDGAYRMELYYTGYKKNDIQSAYIEMGKPVILYPEQKATMEAVATGKAELVEVIQVVGGKFTRNFAMRENDVCFVKLVPLF